jgi:hypothetical protein
LLPYQADIWTGVLEYIVFSNVLAIAAPLPLLLQSHQNAGYPLNSASFESIGKVRIVRRIPFYISLPHYHKTG